MRGFVMGSPVVLTNVDDDPELEVIRAKPEYLICEEYSSDMNVVFWQLNLEPEFYSPEGKRSAFALTADLDLGRDKTFLVANGRTTDSTTHRFWVIDPRTGTVQNFFDLPGGPDLNGDKKWDGAYSVAGTIDVPTETGFRKALVIVCSAGFDLESRGICAVDPWTGEILWEFLTGSPPLYFSVQIVDIDGNGTKEILFPTRSPNNLGGRKINGFSDDRPYLFVLNADGSLDWHRELGTTPGVSFLQVGDLDGNGVLEIVLATQNISNTQGSVQILDPEGQTVASLKRDHHFKGCFLIPGKKENHLDIISGNYISSVFQLGFEDGRLFVRNEVTNKWGLNILGLIDIPKEHNGPGIITQDKKGIGRILDRDLNLIATYKDDQKRTTRLMESGMKNGSPSFILVGSRPGCFILTYNPRNLAQTIVGYFTKPRMLVLAGLILGLAIALLIRKFSSQKHQNTQPLPLPESDDHLHIRERRLHLLEDLEISNHGAMAPLRSLRRLLWMLDAVQSGVGVNPNLVARMKEIWQDCHEDALPRLTNILERARHAQISDSVVEESLASICRIKLALAQLNKENFSAEAVYGQLSCLHKEEKTTEALLQSLRRQVSEYFQTSLPEVMEKVLRANQQVIEENGVKVQVGMLSAMQADGGDAPMSSSNLSCRMDPDELGFILDNLVGNACLAMACAPIRNLAISWQPIDGMVKIEISDTGIGITTEDHQRVLEPGFSQRPGGGLGLPKSQRLLKKYDGHLSVKRSSPGQGTTFLLVVPRG